MIRNDSTDLGSLVSYINDIKPFHTKLVEVQVDYQWNENINVVLNEKHNIDIDLSSVWEYEFISNGKRKIYRIPAVVMPRHTKDIHYCELNAAADEVPIEKILQYTVDGYIDPNHVPYYVDGVDTDGVLDGLRTGAYYIPYNNGVKITVNGTVYTEGTQYTLEKGRTLLIFAAGFIPEPTDIICVDLYQLDRLFMKIDPPACLPTASTFISVTAENDYYANRFFYNTVVNEIWRLVWPVGGTSYVFQRYSGSTGAYVGNTPPIYVDANNYLWEEYELAFDPIGSKVYVSNSGSTVFTLDATTGALLSHTPSPAYLLSVDPYTGTKWSGDYNSYKNLLKLNADGSVAATYPIIGVNVADWTYLGAITFTPTHVYIADYNYARMYVMDKATGINTAHVIDENVDSLAYDESRNCIWAFKAPNKLKKYDLTTNTFTGSWTYTGTFEAPTQSNFSAGKSMYNQVMDKIIFGSEIDEKMLLIDPNDPTSFSDIGIVGDSIDMYYQMWYNNGNCIYYWVNGAMRKYCCSKSQGWMPYTIQNLNADGTISLTKVGAFDTSAWDEELDPATQTWTVKYFDTETEQLVSGLSSEFAVTTDGTYNIDGNPATNDSLVGFIKVLADPVTGGEYWVFEFINAPQLDQTITFRIEQRETYNTWSHTIFAEKLDIANMEYLYDNINLTITDTDAGSVLQGYATGGLSTYGFDAKDAIARTGIDIEMSQFDSVSSSISDIAPEGTSIIQGEPEPRETTVTSITDTIFFNFDYYMSDTINITMLDSSQSAGYDAIILDGGNRTLIDVQSTQLGPVAAFIRDNFVVARDYEIFGDRFDIYEFGLTEILETFGVMAADTNQYVQEVPVNVLTLYHNKAVLPASILTMWEGVYLTPTSIEHINNNTAVKISFLARDPVSFEVIFA